MGQPAEPVGPNGRCRSGPLDLTDQASIDQTDPSPDAHKRRNGTCRHGALALAVAWPLPLVGPQPTAWNGLGPEHPGSGLACESGGAG